ncbi:hypothetical protein NMY22_g3845 [Coprinellus aureogranulatus]|nr:hypothetical protein NMY22_g3845 [Coprinellus aureogranulatus]
MSSAPNPDECAHGADGNLLPADKICFQFDPDDPTPLAPVSKDAIMAANQALLNGGPSKEPRRSNRTGKGGLMQYLLTEEKHNETNKVKAKFAAPHPAGPCKSGRPRKQTTVPVEIDDESEDSGSEFAGGSVTESDVEGDELGGGIGNDELANILPTKTQASRKRNTTTAQSTIHPKCSRPSVTVEEVEDEDAPRPQPLRSSASISSTAGSSNSKTKNPIYYFFRRVNANSGTVQHVLRDVTRALGLDKKIMRITTAMKHNTKYMVDHLSHNFPMLHQVYLALKDEHRTKPPTSLELDLASGKVSITNPAAIAYLKEHGSRPSTIVEAFENQVKAEWNQEEFEKALINWLVTSDQPFSEVENPEFRRLLQYTHSGKDSIEEICHLFSNLKSKVSLSLDCCTSENQHAFMAIIVHYVADDGVLEELLIEFQELHGPHTVENMVEVVWRTIKMYRLEGKIFAIVMDNATNNDKLVEFLEVRFKGESIRFSAKEARMRCMPHIIHLAALELSLLEGIGAITSSECAAAAAGYQDLIAEVSKNGASEDSDKDDEDGGQPKAKGSGADTNTSSDDDLDMSAIKKIRRLIKAVRYSPQRRESWLREVQLAGLRALMLILDVQTQWSSTHLMLNLREAVDSFTAKNREFRLVELSASDWECIETVCKWLDVFQAATREMSATKTPMLSSTITIFHGLQRRLKDALRDLSTTCDPAIKTGIIDAHQKLSNYYSRFDELPYGTWAALLDPHTSYEGLKFVFAGDTSLLANLESIKSRLASFYKDNYSASTLTNVGLAPTSTASNATMSSSSFDFAAIFHRAPTAQPPESELDAYFKTPAADFHTTCPIQWWYTHRFQFQSVQ